MESRSNYISVPTSTQPTSTQPTSTQPTSTQPKSTQPTSTQPANLQPTIKFIEDHVKQLLDERQFLNNAADQKITPDELMAYLERILNVNIFKVLTGKPQFDWAIFKTRVIEELKKTLSDEVKSALKLKLSLSKIDPSKIEELTDKLFLIEIDRDHKKSLKNIFNIKGPLTAQYAYIDVNFYAQVILLISAQLPEAFHECRHYFSTYTTRKDQFSVNVSYNEKQHFKDIKKEIARLDPASHREKSQILRQQFDAMQKLYDQFVKGAIDDKSEEDVNTIKCCLRLHNEGKAYLQALAAYLDAHKLYSQIGSVMRKSIQLRQQQCEYLMQLTNRVDLRLKLENHLNSLSVLCDEHWPISMTDQYQSVEQVKASQAACEEMLTTISISLNEVSRKLESAIEQREAHKNVTIEGLTTEYAQFTLFKKMQLEEYKKTVAQYQEIKLTNKAVTNTSIQNSPAQQDVMVYFMDQWVKSQINNLSNAHLLTLRNILACIEGPRYEQVCTLIEYLQGTVTQNGTSHAAITIPKLIITAPAQSDPNLTVSDAFTVKGGFYRPHGGDHSGKLPKNDLELLAKTFEEAGITLEMLDTLEQEAQQVIVDSDSIDEKSKHQLSQ